MKRWLARQIIRVLGSVCSAIGHAGDCKVLDIPFLTRPIEHWALDQLDEEGDWT